MMNVSCCQINLHKSHTAAAELNERDEKVVFITEPSVRGKDVKSIIRSNTIVLYADGKSSPRAALRVENGLHPWFVPEMSDMDLCVAAIKIENKCVYISLTFGISGEVKWPRNLLLQV